MAASSLSGTEPWLADEAAFGALVDRHRRPLHLHCYRMLGSFEEAEDLVQETLLRAWRGRAGFDGRAQVGTWLHRIATNVCLTALARRPRRVMPPDLGPSTAEPPSDADVSPEIPWLQPYPDRMLDELASADPEPGAAVVSRESVELAYLAAIQHLSPRARAILLMRDVLDWSAKETAALLESTVTSVNSALVRARATLRERLPTLPRERREPTDLADEGRAVLARYMAAHDRGDLPALAALLREDARLIMPPYRGWYEGRETILRLPDALGVDPAFGHLRGVATGANRQPAVAWYLRRPDDAAYRPLALDVLRVADGAIAEITTFASPELFPSFGLPPVLEP
jgi:RNA polymerase sigma-70 factor (ECF subfamily)